MLTVSGRITFSGVKNEVLIQNLKHKSKDICRPKTEKCTPSRKTHEISETQLTLSAFKRAKRCRRGGSHGWREMRRKDEPSTHWPVFIAGGVDWLWRLKSAGQNVLVSVILVPSQAYPWLHPESAWWVLPKSHISISELLEVRAKFLHMCDEIFATSLIFQWD